MIEKYSQNRILQIEEMNETVQFLHVFLIWDFAHVNVSTDMTISISTLEDIEFKIDDVYRPCIKYYPKLLPL